MTDRVELRISNDLLDIGIVRDALDKAGREHSDGGGHEVLVRISVHRGRVDLEIFDDGREFDPLTAAAPDTASQRHSPRPGGLGIHIVRKLVDRFIYERVDGRNHTTLGKSCGVGMTVKGSNG